MTALEKLEEAEAKEMTWLTRPWQQDNPTYKWHQGRLAGIRLAMGLIEYDNEEAAVCLANTGP